MNLRKPGNSEEMDREKYTLQCKHRLMRPIVQLWATPHQAESELCSAQPAQLYMPALCRSRM